MEIEIGILRIERRDAVQGAKLRAWMSGRLLTEFSRRILHVDTEVALLCARLHVPDPKAERDAFIAGIAMVHGFTLVTRNISDFQATGVPLLNPWDGLLA
jgi:predicted nucleic acid-binding protein